MQCTEATTNIKMCRMVDTMCVSEPVDGVYIPRAFSTRMAGTSPAFHAVIKTGLPPLVRRRGVQICGSCVGVCVYTVNGSVYKCPSVRVYLEMRIP